MMNVLFFRRFLLTLAALIWLPLALYFWERHARGHGVRFALYAAPPEATWEAQDE